MKNEAAETIRALLLWKANERGERLLARFAQACQHLGDGEFLPALNVLEGMEAQIAHIRFLLILLRDDFRRSPKAAREKKQRARQRQGGKR